MRASRLAQRLWEHLSDLQFPCPMEEVCCCLNIDLRYADLDELDGVFIRNSTENRTLIIVNDNCCWERQRFSAAHELGHALLRHPPLVFLRNRVWGEHEPWQEAEANRFASQFLMPDFFLSAQKLTTPEAIAKNCRVSMEAARIRAGLGRR